MEQQPKPAEQPKPKSRKMWAIIAAVIIIAVIGGSVYFLTRPPPGTAVSILDDGTCDQSAKSSSCKFGTNPATISKGAAVTWTNNGAVQHTVTSNSTGGGSFTSSGTLNAGDKYSNTFSDAGTYHYYCSIHTWMKADIVVQ